MHLFHMLATLPLVAAHVPGYLPPSKRNTLESRQAGSTAPTYSGPGTRPQLGNIPYGGAGVRTCTQPGTVALTYDDGPNDYTGQLLDMLKTYGFRATFFVSGYNGRGDIDSRLDWVNLVKRMDAEGHQVGNHAWSHNDLSPMAALEIIEEMEKTEKGIRNILGKYPTYMRPPYASCTRSCPGIMTERFLGYVIASYDLETADYNNQDNIQVSKDTFKSWMDQTPRTGGRIVIAHDTLKQTVTSLTPYMLEYLKNNGWKAVTLGECLGDPKQNWYRPSLGSLPPFACPEGGCGTSTDGTCGAAKGTCAGSPFGDCCSNWGNCGKEADWCASDKCNPAFGTCWSGSTRPTQIPSPSATASRTTTPTSPTGGPTSSPGQAPISSQGLCGIKGGETCLGSIWGECCSVHGYCGSESAWCGPNNCDPSFGICSS